MDQFDLNRLKSTFSSLIEGTKTGEEEYENLKALLAKYPYCQPLQMIHAVSVRKNPVEFKQQLSKAAVYAPDRSLLYNFIYHNEKFYETVPEQIETSLTNETPEVTEKDESTFIGSKELNTAQEEVEQETEEAERREPETAEAETKEAEESEEKEAGEIKIPEERPIFDNIASSDYFTFNKSTVDPLSRQQVEKESISTSAEPAAVALSDSPTEASRQGDVEEVSKYHDEELPYTFLWWLQKTRKEHAQTYQPYANLRPQASEALRKTSVDELNHQIIENIFHLQVPIQDEKSTSSSANTIEFELRRQDKKDYLIERFIKEEPQIRPPKAEKIDTENKARKSSEDNLDLVSETLAHIYIEQMLYHKAIDTYKKLSLKFPEKSAYFADQINEIQKKIS